MPARTLFSTLFHEGELDDGAFVAELEEACRALAEDDAAGRRWSREHAYRGYTSYASLNDLPRLANRPPPPRPPLRRAGPAPRPPRGRVRRRRGLRSGRAAAEARQPVG